MEELNRQLSAAKASLTIARASSDAAQERADIESQRTKAATVRAEEAEGRATAAESRATIAEEQVEKEAERRKGQEESLSKLADITTGRTQALEKDLLSQKETVTELKGKLNDAEQAIERLQEELSTAQ